MTLEEAINTPGVVIDRWVIRLGKEDGEFQPWHLPPETFEQDLQAFLECLALKRSVNSIEERMKEEKAKIRAVKKTLRQEAKAREKEDAKAAKKVERERLKTEKAAERERVKLEVKAERERLKADKKKSKEAVSEDRHEEASPDRTGSAEAEENQVGTVQQENQNTGPHSGAVPSNTAELNLAAKMERAGITPVEETKIFASGIAIEKEVPSHPIFNIPTEN